MPSPFPGMDPYLEHADLWGGVHQRLITYASDLLQVQLRPRGYFAEIGERLVVLGPTERPIGPDIVVARRTSPARTAAAAVLEVDEPIEVESLHEEEKQVFVEIRARDGEVISIVEILSPTNKQRGVGREKYLAKQAEVLSSAVNLIEIDLLRAGDHTVASRFHLLRDNTGIGPWNYLVSSHRAGYGPKFQVYPVSVRQRLPRIRIPLRSSEVDAVLDLQAAFDRAYDAGAYADRVDYSQHPVPPLSNEDGAWADELLRGHGLRQSA